MSDDAAPPDPVEPVGSPSPLLVINGGATAEEVAALLSVLQTMSAAASLALSSEETGNVSAWAAPARRLRAGHQPGPGGWRASALPR